MTKYTFKFKQGMCEGTYDAKTYGGKGAGLFRMTADGLNVPPGFVIPCATWAEYVADSKGTMDKLMPQVEESMTWLAQQFGYMPLVSVRSGAPISCPGMMDTILNVGLTMDGLDSWVARIGQRAASDSFRRLIQMLGATAYGVPMSVFDFQLTKAKKEFGAKSDTDLTALELDNVSDRYLEAFEANKGHGFPVSDANAQLRAAIEAVFESWMNPRAIEYRKINKIDPAMGTAVTVQSMVFGNMGEDSGTGVLFSRDPSTGEKGMMGEFLTNAQGEDVVAGIRTPMNINMMGSVTVFNVTKTTIWAGIHKELEELCQKLEVSYKDMVDVEFTVQKGELFVLQSRVGKRSARAAFKIAVDQVTEGLIDKPTAIKRLTVDQFKTVRRPTIDPKFKVEPNVVGLPACPGVVTGRPVFSSDAAISCNEPCILVTHETNPNDIGGMAAARGILTQTGGATSHAAVVARAMDKTCVVGCTGLDIEALQVAQKPNEHYGLIDKITIDGSTGNVWFQVDVPVIDSSDAPEVKTVMEWCQSILGTCEVAPVDLGMDKPHRVMAAYWWGQKEVLEAVLDGLAELPSREHVALDLRGPHELVPTADATLASAFGLGPDFLFGKFMVSRLLKRAAQMKGLRLLHAALYADDDGEALQATGFVIDMEPDDPQAVPKAAPMEFAAFTVLSR